MDSYVTKFLRVCMRGSKNNHLDFGAFRFCVKDWMKDKHWLNLQTLPKPAHIARAANRHRQKLRPEDPTDLNFDLRPDCIPDNFLQCDVTVKDRRYLIFASLQQIMTLTRARTWYLDGTFKLVREPFKQLLTINAFVRSGNYAKQLPLIFVVMSGRKKTDYKKVNMHDMIILFRSLLNLTQTVTHTATKSITYTL